MALLSMAFLGPCHVLLDGRRAPSFRYHKALALLAYLAIESDRPHGRRRLADLLWSCRDEPRARKAMRDALHDLRRAIGDASADPPFLLLGRDTIQFNLASHYQLDVHDFELQVARCGLAVGPWPIGAGLQQHIEALEGAVSLYYGDFLADMPAVNSGLFEQWVLSKREHLHVKAVRALQRLAAAYVQGGEYELAQGPVRRQLELEPWQEEAHRQLMWLLARSGHRSAALVQYRTCRQLLARELDEEPGDQTRALYRQIRDGRLDEPFYPALAAA